MLRVLPVSSCNDPYKSVCIVVSINSFSGPVPGFFLASVDPDSFEFAGELLEYYLEGIFLAH